MRAEHDATDTGVFVEALFQLEPQVETWFLPFHPADGTAKQFFGDFLAILCRCECYGSIGMEVVDVFERKKSVQRRIDRRRLGRQIVNAMVEQFYHFIFEFNATVDIFQAAQAIHIQCRQSVSFHGTQIATGTLHPHNFGFLSRQGVFCHCFAGGIASAVIGQSQIGSQQIGTIHEQGDFITRHGCGLGIIPQITHMFKTLVPFHRRVV